ncbi:hypothetical protein HTZ77_28110 [Nonomuraea sp. SMC257]|uniref:Integral membrane protein n=1 Tax=Nonomuraea montanisoli TaxID=2741721 RepID=A0A7Y6M4Y5_9ACTN|nr:DUF6113 family protein [Nonomuraea montanisoli]NUW35268.1 hypothetical protein [Nonomuraea montanisoli]
MEDREQAGAVLFDTEEPGRPGSALGGAVYGMLFVLGLVMGVVGGFTQAAWHVGAVPVAAVGWLLALFGVCLGAGRMLRTRVGAAVTAAGWLLVSMPFSVQLSSGDLVISNSPAGYVYLYGGVLAAAAAFLLSPTSSRGSWLLRGHVPRKPT